MAQTRLKDYTDLDLDFTAHPVTKDVIKKTGPDAIIRSVRNLVLTNFYERPFRSYIGSNAQKLLFENVTEFTAILLKDHITEVITNFEPRVFLRNVDVIMDPDHNGYYARLVFQINNRTEPVQTVIFLERIR